jgi:three-Cys-motif partner protein
VVGSGRAFATVGGEGRQDVTLHLHHRLFAGAGAYTDVVTGQKTDGSPVIFARQAVRYAKEHPGRRLNVICVERNKKNMEALKQRVGGFSLVTLLLGSFARHIDGIVSMIGLAPTLILFDPIGLKPIAADTIRPLVHRKGKTDVFMVLHFKVVHRTAGMLLETGHADPTIPGAVRAGEDHPAQRNSSLSARSVSTHAGCSRFAQSSRTQPRVMPESECRVEGRMSA